MKKLLTTAALIVGFSGAAYADDSITQNGITLYGTVDVGVTYDTHGAPANPYYPPGTLYSVGSASNKSLFSLTPGGMGNSKIGIKGIDEFYEGWSALFKLETGFNPISGVLSSGAQSLVNQNGVPQAQRTANGDSSREGQMFNQQAYVGIQNNIYGTLMFGRQNTLQLDAIGAYDPQYSSYAFSLVGYTGVSGGGAGDTQDARWDNSIKYLAHYGPLHGGAMYQFGGTNGRNDIGYAVNVGGEYAGFSLDGVFTHKKDQIAPGQLSAAQTLIEPVNSLTGTVSDNTDYSVQAKYSAERWSVMGGYQYIVYANPSSPLEGYSTGVTPTYSTPAYPGVTGIGGYLYSVLNNTAYAQHKILQVEFVGGRYHVTQKLDASVGFYHYDQNSFRVAGGHCSSTVASSCSGTQNNVSFLLDYHLSKRFDVYGGLMYSQVLDGLANGFLHNNNIDPTAGLRFVF